jgi:hypothetical protein
MSVPVMTNDAVTILQFHSVDTKFHIDRTYNKEIYQTRLFSTPKYVFPLTFLSPTLFTNLTYKRTGMSWISYLPVRVTKCDSPLNGLRAYGGETQRERERESERETERCPDCMR